MAKSTKGKLPVAKPSSMSDCVPATAYKPSKEDQDRQRRYKAEDALRTIQQAKEIEKDKGLMKDVKALAKEQVSKLKTIC